VRVEWPHPWNRQAACSLFFLRTAYVFIQKQSTKTQTIHYNIRRKHSYREQQCYQRRRRRSQTPSLPSPESTATHGRSRRSRPPLGDETLNAEHARPAPSSAHCTTLRRPPSSAKPAGTPCKRRFDLLHTTTPAPHRRWRKRRRDDDEAGGPESQRTRSTATPRRPDAGAWTTRGIQRSASARKMTAAPLHSQQRGDAPPPKPPPTAPPPPQRRRQDHPLTLHYIHGEIRGFPSLPLPEQLPETEGSHGSPPRKVDSTMRF
jgi:hypothetical protein